MLNILEFGNYNGFNTAMNCICSSSNGNCCGDTSIINSSPTWRWLVYGKLPQDVVVTPTSTDQVIQAQGINRYLRTVTVRGVTTALTVTPTTSVQTFTAGPYGTVTVNAAS